MREAELKALGPRRLGPTRFFYLPQVYAALSLLEPLFIKKRVPYKNGWHPSNAFKLIFNWPVLFYQWCGGLLLTCTNHKTLVSEGMTSINTSWAGTLEVIQLSILRVTEINFYLKFYTVFCPKPKCHEWQAYLEHTNSELLYKK